MIAKKNCNLCGSNTISLILEKDGYEIVKCSTCKLVYVNTAISIKELKDLYKEGYYNGKYENVYKNYIDEQEIRIKAFKKELSPLLKLRKEGKLLEIGSAAGFLEAANTYFETIGVELSEYSASYSKKNFNHNIHVGTVFTADFPPKEFDFVVMWDVIEHLDNPKDTLHEINRIIKQGGILAFSTGDIDSNIPKKELNQWKMIAPPWHLYYFSKSTIKKLLLESGFEIVKMRTRGLITKRKILNNKLTNYIGNIFNKGDIMVIYCKKEIDIS